MSNVTKQEVIEELWYRGELRYKCHPVQREMYDLFYKSEDFSTLVWVLSRQSGKSILLAILGIETALKEPGSIIKVVCDTKVHLESLFIPKMNEVLFDCPEALKPRYIKADKAYVFANGSQIQLAGSDGKNYERLRGQKSALVLIDEAGFCNDLREMIDSVLFPTLTHTGGKIVLATTPPSDPDHKFFWYMEKAENEGKLTLKTVYDNPLLDKRQLEVLIQQYGGTQSEQFRREFLCECIRSVELSVIPEFTPEMEKQIVREWLRPPFFDTYVSMDLGFKDLTVVIFGYYDFRCAKIVIEDEYVINMADKESSIEKLTLAVSEKEKLLWTNPLTGEVKTPLIRVSDVNPIVTQEMSKYSQGNITFVSAQKYDKDSALNNMRALIGAGKIIIDPRCKTLIKHLRNVKWASKDNKNTFARSADNGHYDGAEALKYMIRAINFGRNPYPSHYNLDPNNSFINPSLRNQRPATNPVDVFKRIFAQKKVGRYGR